VGDAKDQRWFAYCMAVFKVTDSLWIASPSFMGLNAKAVEPLADNLGGPLHINFKLSFSTIKLVAVTCFYMHFKYLGYKQISLFAFACCLLECDI